MINMNDYFIFSVAFTICSFLFFIFLLMIYFHKSVNYSLKNIIYKRMIYIGLFWFLCSFVYIILFNSFKKLLYILLLRKLSLISFVAILMLWAYYVIILAFDKNKEASSFIRLHHTGIDLCLLLVFGIITVIEFFLPINVSASKGDVINSMTGIGLVFPNVLCIILSLLPIPFMILEKRMFYKKFLSYYVILFLLVILGIVTWLYPVISISGFILTVSFYLIYFRLENPDIVYIRSYYKDHERLRSLHEKYGFLFNMSPELRDMLNEISFMKENYLIDEKRRISKRKLDTLISDFIKSSEIGETKKTNVDDEGIEILELDDDIPEEMLVTKEIYSIQELEEILKEDNLPKW